LRDMAAAGVIGAPAASGLCRFSKCLVFSLVAFGLQRTKSARRAQLAMPLMDSLDETALGRLDGLPKVWAVYAVGDQFHHGIFPDRGVELLRLCGQGGARDAVNERSVSAPSEQDALTEADDRRIRPAAAKLALLIRLRRPDFIATEVAGLPSRERRRDASSRGEMGDREARHNSWLCRESPAFSRLQVRPRDLLSSNFRSLSSPSASVVSQNRCGLGGWQIRHLRIDFENRRLQILKIDADFLRPLHVYANPDAIVQPSLRRPSAYRRCTTLSALSHRWRSLKTVRTSYTVTRRYSPPATHCSR
jgi:hypothetical protein